MITFNEASELVDNLENDYTKLSKEELDLTNGRNTNLFPYKGQFSPDLVKGLLKKYSNKDTCVFDPFLGCGTTIIEATKNNLSAYGTEINPAAFEMANTIIFTQIPLKKRGLIIQRVLDTAKKIDIRYEVEDKELLKEVSQNLYEQIECLIHKSKDPYQRNILTNSYLRLLVHKKPHTKALFLSLMTKHIEIITSLPYSKLGHKAFLSDARTIPLPVKSIDLIITSPPYINVFNYHQHNRTFIDRVYKNALLVAKSEIGANRKHRQNRLLTVIQYVIDMTECFYEMKRVLKNKGRVIMVIGKSSRVRGIDFRNDHIITAIALNSGLKLIEKQERAFTNQFGQKIVEKVLHFLIDNRNYSTYSTVDTYSLAKEVLNYYNTSSLSFDVKKDLVSAIEKLTDVKASLISNLN